jgi:hypothetical protein
MVNNTQIGVIEINENQQEMLKVLKISERILVCCSCWVLNFEETGNPKVASNHQYPNSNDGNVR